MNARERFTRDVAIDLPLVKHLMQKHPRLTWRTQAAIDSCRPFVRFSKRLQKRV